MAESDGAGGLSRVLLGDRSATVKELQASLLESTRQAKAEWQARVQAESRLEALEARLSGLSYQLDQERQKCQGLEAEIQESRAENNILTEELQAAEQLSAFHAERAQQQLEAMRARLQAAEDELSAQHEAREHGRGLRGSRGGQVAELLQQHAQQASGDMALERIEILRDKLQECRAENIDLASRLDSERATSTALRSTLSDAHKKLESLLSPLTPPSPTHPTSPPSQVSTSQLLPTVSQIIQDLQNAQLSAQTTQKTATHTSSHTSSQSSLDMAKHAGLASPTKTSSSPSSKMTLDAASAPDQDVCSVVGAVEAKAVSEGLSAAESDVVEGGEVADGEHRVAPSAQQVACQEASASLEARVTQAVQVLAKLWSKYGDNPWHRGIVKGIAEAVQLLAGGTGAQDPSGRTPLHIAAARGQADIVAVLLQGGAELQAVDSTGRTALHSAAEKGHLDVVRALLQAAALLQEPTPAVKQTAQSSQTTDPSTQPSTPSAPGSRPPTQHSKSSATLHPVPGTLQLAGDSKTPAQSLKELGQGSAAPVLGSQGSSSGMLVAGLLGARNGAGDTALHCAAGFGQEMVVGELLSAGAGPWEEDGEGRTALQKALLWGYAGTGLVLLQAMVRDADEVSSSGLEPNKEDQAGSGSWGPAQKILDDQVQALLTQLQADAGGLEAVKVDMERVLAVQAQVQATLQERASPMIACCNEEALLAALTPSLGFYRSRPVAAVLLFRCCIQWGLFQSETTTFFQRALLKIGSQLDEHAAALAATLPTTRPLAAATAASAKSGNAQPLRARSGPAGDGPSIEQIDGTSTGPVPASPDSSPAATDEVAPQVYDAAAAADSVQTQPQPLRLESSQELLIHQPGQDVTLAYWLCNAAALLSVSNELLKPVRDAGSGGIKSTSRGGALLAVVRSRLNTLRDMPYQLNLGSLGRIKPAQQHGSQETSVAANPYIAAHFPALVFKRQLDALITKTFCSLRDNAKARMSHLLPACTHQDRQTSTSTGLAEAPSTGWSQLVSILGDLLKTADSNCLAPTLVGELFHQLLTWLDTNMFNQLLLRRECCSFSNARFLAEGLAQVDSWLASIGRDMLGSVGRDLEHIRQAVHFLMLSTKAKRSLRHIVSDVCPALSPSQVYILCSKFFDDENGTGGLAQEVLHEMQAQLGSEADADRNFLLDDQASANPVLVSELLQKMPPQDLLSSIPVPEALAKSTSHGSFTFLATDLNLASP